MNSGQHQKERYITEKEKGLVEDDLYITIIYLYDRRDEK